MERDGMTRAINRRERVAKRGGASELLTMKLSVNDR